MTFLMILFVTLSIIDTVTTVLVFKRDNLVELNPIINQLHKWFDSVGIVMFKVLVVIVVILANNLLIYVFLNIFYSWVAYNNIKLLRGEHDK